MRAGVLVASIIVLYLKEEDEESGGEETRGIQLKLLTLF